MSPVKASFREENAPRNAPKMTKDELDFLASSRPTQGPISPQRLNQQFVHVLGLQVVAPSLLPPLGDSPQPTGPDRQGARLQSSRAHPRMAVHDVEAAFQAGAQVIITKGGPTVIWPDCEETGKLAHTPTTEHEVVEEIIDAHGSTAVMYAVCEWE